MVPFQRHLPDYFIFDDEGHGFTKRNNRIKASNKYLEFLNEYLK